MAVARGGHRAVGGLGRRPVPPDGGAGGGDVESAPAVVRYENIDGQDVNIVDPAKIRAEIANAIGGDTAMVTTTAAPRTAHAAESTDDGRDGQRQQHLRVGRPGRRAARRARFTIEQVRDRESGEPIDTVVSYGRVPRPTPSPWRRCWASTTRPRPASRCPPTRSASSSARDTTCRRPTSNPMPRRASSRTTAEGWYGMTIRRPRPGPAHGRRRNPLRELIRQTTPRSASAPRGVRASPSSPDRDAGSDRRRHR